LKVTILLRTRMTLLQRISQRVNAER